MDTGMNPLQYIAMGIVSDRTLLFAVGDAFKVFDYNSILNGDPKLILNSQKDLINAISIKVHPRYNSI